MGGAVDQEEFNKVITDNLSPEGIAAVITLLSMATRVQTDDATTAEAYRQATWLAVTLLETLGTDKYDHINSKFYYKQPI